MGSRPASPFSFSDVGNAFQIIIHMPVAMGAGATGIVGFLISNHTLTRGDKKQQAYEL